MAENDEGLPPSGDESEPLGERNRHHTAWSPEQGQSEERRREEEGNRGPEEEPGFGQGA